MKNPFKKKRSFGNTDGFSRAVGLKIVKIGGWPYTLTGRWMMNLNKCPACQSEETFHHQRLKDLEARLQKKGLIYENVFRSFSRTEENSHILTKYDICLKCSHEWAFQIFVYDRTDETALRLMKDHFGAD